MATANFTECGNHGLFIIDSENEYDYPDTVRNFAIDWQDWASTQSLSYGELLEELKENGIL